MYIVRDATSLNAINSIVSLKHIESEVKGLIMKITDSITMVLIPREKGVTCLDVARDNRYSNSIATGFYIDSTTVVTSMHSIQSMDGERVCLLDLDGNIVEGEIIDVDPKWDLVFIHSASKHNTIPLRDSIASIGDFVIVCGVAYGILRPFLSIGIVSGSEVKADMGYGLVEGLLLVSTPILFGMSGSPIIDLKGLAVGMIVAKAFDANEFSLAIPSTRILYSYRILKKYGKITHIVLGINVLSLRSMISTFKLQYGLVVTDIINSNIRKFCNIGEGDILLTINNRNMYAIEDLRLALDEALLNNNVLAIEYFSKRDKKTHLCNIDDLAMFITPRPF